MDVREVRVMIDVADLARETQFWVSELGFAIVRDFDGGVLLEVGSTVVEFFSSADAPSSQTRFSLRVDDLDARWNQWAQCDVVGFELRSNPWGDRSFSLITPNQIEVILFQPDA